VREPLAYHLSWTCYGQWLQGDARGYVDRQHRTPGEPYVYNNPQFYTAAANRMTEPPVWLSDEHRRRVRDAMEAVCAHRQWRLEKQNVQPDHVHVVVRARDVTGKRAMKALKGWATRALNALGPRRSHWWTVGGKVEQVWNERRLRQVIAYVANQHFPSV